MLEDAANGSSIRIELVVDHLPRDSGREFSELIEGEVMWVRPGRELPAGRRFGVMGEEGKTVASAKVAAGLHRLGNPDVIDIQEEALGLAQMGPGGVFEDSEDHPRTYVLLWSGERVAAW